VVRVVSATYRHSRDCIVGGNAVAIDGNHVPVATSADGADYDPMTSDSTSASVGLDQSMLTADCSRDEPGNPACVGNRNCSFMTPWVYISAECGYSNQFRIVYQCVPGKFAIFPHTVTYSYRDVAIQ
jgi:hypothetical protein